MTDPLTDPPTDPLIGLAPVRELVSELAASGATVATAESLTAGLLSAMIACVPGASTVLRGGLVVYATDLKGSLADVAPAVLAADGPVAASTARELAVGARGRCRADWGIGLTGVAGPDPQDGWAPGTAFLGIAGPGTTEVVRLSLPGDRWQIRVGAAAAAVAHLRRKLAHRAGTKQVVPDVGTL